MSPEKYYESLISSAESEQHEAQSKINKIGYLRLAIVVSTIIVCIFCDAIISWISTGVAIAVMLSVMRIHERYFAERRRAKSKKKFAERQIKIIAGKFDNKNSGKEFIDASHPFTYDLDIFGEKSIFSIVNSTISRKGRNLLAQWFSSPEETANDVPGRQQAIKELSEMHDFRLRFVLAGTDCESDKKDLPDDSLKEIPTFRINLFQKIYIWLSPLLFAILISLSVADIIGSVWIFHAFVLSLFIVGSTTKRTSRLHEWLDKSVAASVASKGLLQLIENTDFKSAELINARNRIATDNDAKASTSIKKLQRILHNLDQRYNVVGFALLNGFLAWDWRQLNNADKWMKLHSDHIEQWDDAICKFDAFVSLGIFAFNNPENVYPQTDDNVIIEAEGLTHPLIPKDKVIDNPCPPISKGSFLIITGANMAGKSTYLRTIGVNYLLAMTGCPVFARQMKFSKAELFTSLRSTDSLADNESYFFAELRRLQRIGEKATTGKKMLILLDEILKGTNSRDKQKGSLKFIEKLIVCNIGGMIATHDLIVGELAEKFPDNISNYCFEASITDNTLSFSYKLESGLATQLNACFLMQKMGIIDD